MTDIAEFVITKTVGDKGPEDVETRNQSLSAMRRVLVNSQNVTVAVGGLTHRGDGIVPGVAEEIAFAREKGIPQFLIGGLGGLTKELTETVKVPQLNNSLSDEVNLLLFRTDDVTACVNVLFEHLAGSRPLELSALQPVKWNPGNGAILDHRDGSIDSSTDYILRALAA